VTVEYFSAPVEVRLESGEYVLAGSTPKLAFVRRDTFGYSLNGKQFLVPQGGSYGVVQQTYGGTTARILGGVNTSTAVDGAGRPLTKAVDTGWADATDVKGLASHILTLWGMARALGASETDVYALSLTYAPATIPADQLRSGTFGLATRRPDGTWVNAVDGNAGGSKTFVSGPWNPSYALGTYGVDPATHTAWAVINYNADFALARGLK
jgi:hypothetical protein